jgi:hypothetical protein
MTQEYSNNTSKEKRDTSSISMATKEAVSWWKTQGRGPPHAIARKFSSRSVLDYIPELAAEITTMGHVVEGLTAKAQGCQIEMYPRPTRLWQHGKILQAPGHLSPRLLSHSP